MEDTMNDKLTSDNLRMLLFNVSNQEMTVRELRTVLFNANFNMSGSDLQSLLRENTKEK